MQEDTAKGIRITWGVAVMVPAITYFLGGPYWAAGMICLGIILVLRGHFPRWFKASFWTASTLLGVDGKPLPKHRPRFVLSRLAVAGAILALLLVSGALFWGASHVATSPDFKLSILGGIVFIPDQDSALTGIAIEVRIRNSGTPSIATDWSMLVHLPRNDRIIAAQLTKPPPVLTLNGPAGKVLLHASESIEDKVASKPMRAGDPPVQGWLLFYLTLPKPDVIAPDTILEIRVEDFSGHVFSKKQRMGDWLQR
jgi:hypothetical protein